MSDYASELDTLLKYAAENDSTITGLMRGMPDEHRWGLVNPSQHRHFLADALRDQGRVAEADLVADSNRGHATDSHIVFHEGEVKPGKFNEQPLFAATGELADHLRGLDSWALDDLGSTFHGDPDPVNATDHAEDYEPLGKNEHRVWGGEYDNFWHDKRHITDLPAYIADHTNDNIDRYADYDNWSEEDSAETDRLLDRVRQAPTEEVDDGYGGKYHQSVK